MSRKTIKLALQAADLWDASFLPDAADFMASVIPRLVAEIERLRKLRKQALEGK